MAKFLTKRCNTCDCFIDQVSVSTATNVLPTKLLHLYRSVTKDVMMCEGAIYCWHCTWLPNCLCYI